jgi:DnaJ-class molecular chaperone
MEKKDYYQILGVEKSADPKQIKEAYRELAFQYHPDRNKDNPASAENMKAVNEAYAVLSNPEKRDEYDTLRHRFGSSAYSQFRKQYSEQDIYRDSDIQHIFEEMTRVFGLRGFDEIFGDFSASRSKAYKFQKPGVMGGGIFFSGNLGKTGQAQKRFSFSQTLGKLSQYAAEKMASLQPLKNGANIYDVIHIHPEKAHQGGPYAYFLKKKKKKLVVKIPPGIREGQQIRLAGMGEAGKGGGQAGDLYLKVALKKSVFKKIKNFISGFGMSS